MGGSSPADSPQLKHADAKNQLPSFITANGPMREARLVRHADDSPDCPMGSSRTC